MTELGQFRPAPPPVEKPVWIDFDVLYGPAPDHVATSSEGSIRDRIRRSLKLTGRAPGMLRGWVRSIDGRWLGLCDFTISSTDGAQAVRQVGSPYPRMRCRRAPCRRSDRGLEPSSYPLDLW